MLDVFVSHLYAVVVDRGRLRGTECIARYARAEVIVHFIHLFLVSHAYGHSFSIFINNVRLYGWRVVSLPFIIYTLAVK